MSLTFSNISPRTQLIITAISASLATVTLLQLYNDHKRRTKRKELDQEIQRSLDAHDFGQNTENTTNLEELDLSSLSTSNKAVIPDPPKGGQIVQYDEDLIREQLTRNYAFFGEEGMQRIRQATVVVVGCGGVGSWAAVMLVRSWVCLRTWLLHFIDIDCFVGNSGVSKIRLVDFDYVSLSSLNRHATATLADVATPKVKCVEKMLTQIAKWVEVDSRIDIWRREEGGYLLEGADWVIGRSHQTRRQI